MPNGRGTQGGVAIASEAQLPPVDLSGARELQLLLERERGASTLGLALEV